MIEGASFLKIIFLGLLEGITEFLPVSSTAHLVIVSNFFDFSKILENNIFEIFVQSGAILAVLIFYKKKIICEIKLRKIHLLKNITLSTVPSLLIGFLFYSQIKLILLSPIFITINVILGGIVIIVVEKFLKLTPKYKDIRHINTKTAFLIGIFQAISIILPGMSRAASTIIGGIILKLDRKTATEFSFFLSIPIILMASTYDLYKNVSLIQLSDIIILILGLTISFVSSLLVIKLLLSFIKKYSYFIFGIYRVVIGLFTIIFLILPFN